MIEDWQLRIVEGCHVCVCVFVSVFVSVCLCLFVCVCVCVCLFVSVRTVDAYKIISRIKLSWLQANPAPISTIRGCLSIRWSWHVQVKLESTSLPFFNWMMPALQCSWDMLRCFFYLKCLSEISFVSLLSTWLSLSIHDSSQAWNWNNVCWCLLLFRSLVGMYRIQYTVHCSNQAQCCSTKSAWSQGQRCDRDSGWKCRGRRIQLAY